VNSPLLNYGSPVIGNPLGTNYWNTTDKVMNWKEWNDDKLLLGVTGGSLVTG